MDLGVPDCLPEDSWFRRWMELWPTAEAPKSFMLFSAMSMLGACLGRRVYMDMDIHIVRPMLNMIFIGPSGIGKSSSVSIAKRLLNYMPPIHVPQFIEGGATKEKLHEDLGNQSKTIVFAPELAAFFSKEKYKEALIPYVTQLLDYEDRIELRTRRDGTVVVAEPSVSIIGGSTLDWLQDQLPGSALGGGFLARFLILSEDIKGQRIANPHRILSAKVKRELDERRERVFKEFTGLCNVEPGNFDYEDYDAAEAYARWYNAHQPESGNLAPFAARAGEFILRLSILISVSCKRRSISVEDINSAISLYTPIYKRLGRIVAMSTPHGKSEQLVYDCIGEKPTNLKEVSDKLRRQLSLKAIAEHIEDLVVMKWIDSDDNSQLTRR
jgi:hypothetical protein